jgi:hypothetical protein
MVAHYEPRDYSIAGNAPSQPTNANHKRAEKWKQPQFHYQALTFTR